MSMGMFRGREEEFLELENKYKLKGGKMGIEKAKELNKNGELSISQLVENNDFLNKVMVDSWDIEETKHSKEVIEVELQNSVEIKLRKQTALLQTLDTLKNVIAYGELDEEIKQIENSLKDVEEDLKTLDDDLEAIRVVEI